MRALFAELPFERGGALEDEAKLGEGWTDIWRVVLRTEGDGEVEDEASAEHLFADCGLVPIAGARLEGARRLASDV